MAQPPDKSLPPAPSRAVDSFLDALRGKAVVAASGKRGRMIFALDATMSRQPTWDLAQRLQARMFEVAGKLGGLDAQLVYFRGMHECRASRFVADGAGLGALMGQISCQGGHTQMVRVLEHVRTEAGAKQVGALIYVGDAMEEHVDEVCALAGEVALLGVKAFMFQEGGDPSARQAFGEIARITGGAYATFDASAPQRLADLLGAAAAYAAGGRPALEKQAREGGAAARLLLEQMR